MSAATPTAPDVLAGCDPADRKGNIARLVDAGWTRIDAQSKASRYARGLVSARTFTATAASAIKPMSIDWLWQDFLPLGALSLLYGPEGDGKSTLTMMLAAMATRGTLPGALEGTPATVEIVAFEDDPAAVLVPRLLAAGADLERVFIHGGDAGDGLLTLPDDVEAFGASIAERGSRLVIIDPLPDALREGLKDNNNGDVRSAIVPLHRMAQEAGVAVLGVTHPNKGATDAANKVMGSKAWRSVPRSVLLYGRDPDDLNGPTRVVAVSKANYAGKPARRVKIDSVQVEGVQHPQPRAVLGGESSYTDADLILANAGVVGRHPHGRTRRAEGGGREAAVPPPGGWRRKRRGEGGVRRWGGCRDFGEDDATGARGHRGHGTRHVDLGRPPGSMRKASGQVPVKWGDPVDRSSGQVARISPIRDRKPSPWLYTVDSFRSGLDRNLTGGPLAGRLDKPVPVKWRQTRAS